MTSCPSLRCSICHTCWPNAPLYYSYCPECEQETYLSPESSIDQAEADQRRRTVQAIANAETLRAALSRHRHEEFERWLDEHGRR